MGLGIAYVAAVKAKVPVLLYDRSKDQVQKGLALMDKLLDKDVKKGKIESAEAAKEARDRVVVLGEEEGIRGLRDVDMCVEVRVCNLTWCPLTIAGGGADPASRQAASENFSLKAKLFASMAAELRPDAILGSNTSSISITKIAASALPQGLNPSSEEGKASASRVVGPSLYTLAEGLQTSADTFPGQAFTSSIRFLSCHWLN